MSTEQWAQRELDGGTASSCINLILRRIIWLLRKENDTAVLTLSVDAKLR
jgi:hypothetical protein